MSDELQPLMETLQFSEHDLQTNRDGVLSDRQRAQLSAARRRNALVGASVVGGFILATVIFLFWGIVSANQILQGLGVVLLVCNIFATWMVTRNWLRVENDLRANQVEALEGPTQHVARQFGRAVAYSIRVGDRVEIPTSLATFKAFAPDSVYRIYRTRYSHTIVSAEKVG